MLTEFNKCERCQYHSALVGFSKQFKKMHEVEKHSKLCVSERLKDFPQLLMVTIHCK